MFRSVLRGSIWLWRRGGELRVEYLERQLKRRQERLGLEFRLADGAGAQAFVDAQDRLGVGFPVGVSRFYEAHNGLTVVEPELEVFGLDRLVRVGSEVVFARFDGRHDVAFRVDARNVADEWDIVSVESGVCVTRTMASFWSNKILAWVDARREVWTSRVVASGL